MKRSVRLLAQGVLCLGVAAAAASIAPSAASAASTAGPETTATTTTTTTSYAVPAATCARIKAQFPDKASDPRICTGTHIEKRTLKPSGGAAGVGAKTNAAVTPASCFWGTAWFDDQYVEFPGLFSTQMKSTFSYQGCVNPTVVINWCYVNYSRFGYSVSNLSCGNYTTSIPSRAALQVGWANEPAGLGGYRFWQRRECYKGGPGTCNWNWG